MPFRAQKSVFDRLAEVCEVAKMNMAEKRNHDASLMAYLDAKNQLYYFKNGERMTEERGYKDGMEKGLEKGLEQGLEKGMEKGIEQKTIEIIKNLSASGMDVPFIAKVTNQTEERVRAILGE